MKKSLHLPFSIVDENSREIISLDLPLKIYRFHFREREDISLYLQNHNSGENGTILESIQLQYQRAGMNLNKKKQEKMTNDKLELILKQPSMKFYLFYSIIGFSFETIQQFIKQYYPHEDLYRILFDICENYQVSIDQTFPSLRDEVSNRKTLNSRRIAIPVLLGKKKRKISSSLIDEEEEYDTGNEEEEEEDIDVNEWIKNEKTDRKMEDKRRKKKKKMDWEKEYDRIIPISILPIFLSHLPGFYQTVNMTLSLCEELEIMIWKEIQFTNYDDYVRDQMRVFKHNRKVIAFQYQTIQFDRPNKELDQYELILKENELFQFRLLQSEYDEMEKKCNQLLDSRIKKLENRNGTL